jgi:hypothetical protein
MTPLDFQRAPDLRRLEISAPIAATKADDTNATIDRTVKKGAENF